MDDRTESHHDFRNGNGTGTGTGIDSPAGYDAVVVGGGPAGLQAALTLGRMHRRTLLVDSGLIDAGHYRNGAVEHLHNFLTHDGTPPAELRAAARAELTAYAGVTVHAGEVSSVAVGQGAPVDQGAGTHPVTVLLADGRRVTARALVLATGLRDDLPPIPGLAELWGTLAYGCPYCHGHELTGRRIGVLGGAAPRARQALHLAGTGAVEWLLDGAEPEPALVEEAVRAGVRPRHGRVREIAATPEGAVLVQLDDGCRVEVDGLFAGGALRQAAPFAEQLGLDLLPSGCVAVDDFQRTSLPAVYAAGDLAHRPALPQPMASVLAAAAAGQLAAATCDQDLLAADHPVLSGAVGSVAAATGAGALLTRP